MKKDDIFFSALELLSDISGLDSHSILFDTNEDASDVRFVLVACLAPLLTDADIASRLHRTPQGVGHIRRNPKKSSKWIVRSNLQELRKQLETILSSTI